MYKKIFFLLLLVININAHAFVQEIGPGVFVHIGKHLDVDEGYDGDICNIGFIVGEESIAVIDTGGSYLVAKNFLNTYLITLNSLSNMLSILMHILITSMEMSFLRMQIYMATKIYQRH